ncbi:Vps62-related protein [Amycolatopsis sp. H20-H5]|uniref:Vps62-related protein n=1 Tax=Amycolatopsis sp. H20-H5 TaxID=3046309 RepID=UPI002DB7F740|nr:Vps62-related protein [Amycolatopsis sp. H20-H5]MEC3978743.1 Vps62-related protein [Amycolatopsis sp. H20-H5]
MSLLVVTSAGTLPHARSSPLTGRPEVVSVRPADQFQRIWDDGGSGADHDVSIWRPDVSRYSGYRSLGDVVMKGYGAPSNTFLVRDDAGVAARPVGYRLIWDDRGSGGDHDVSLWEPVAPAGYTCLGSVAEHGYDTPPSTDVVRCLQSSYTTDGAPGKEWDDSGSGAHHDVSFWQANPVDHLGLSPSTFVARGGHDDNGGGQRYRVIDKTRTDVPALSGQPVTLATAGEFAPRVRLHPAEYYFPSTAEFHLGNVHQSNGYLVTNQALGCDSCTDPAFLNGMRPGSAAVSAYAEVVHRTDKGRPTEVTDVVYWMFYPYNSGKRVCVGLMSRWGCVGGYSTFGNHVGDWEHVTLRFVGNLPAKIFYSQHDGGQEFTFGDKHVRLAGWRPEVYSAKGSHGSYPGTGVHVYRELPNGDNLSDVTGAGIAWDTAPALVPFAWQPRGTYAGPLSWLNLTSRWGNPKSGCEISGPISGECVLDDGPEGPMLKDYSQPPLRQLE